jgi:hypothetical protein
MAIKKVKQKARSSGVARFIVARGKGKTVYVVLARRAISDAKLAKKLDEVTACAGVTRVSPAFIVAGKSTLEDFLGIKLSRFGV